MNKFFILCVLLMSTSLCAETIVNVDFNYYDISPTDKASLAIEMDTKTPIKSANSDYRGNTDWQVTWRFNWQIENGLCQIGNVYTNVNIIYTMPRLAPSFKVDLSVKKAFDGYYLALLKHETGHGLSGKYAGEEIQSTLINLQPYQNCEALKIAANDAAQKIIKKYNQRDIDYDKETNHGFLEGVNLNNFIK